MSKKYNKDKVVNLYKNKYKENFPKLMGSLQTRETRAAKDIAIDRLALRVMTMAQKATIDFESKEHTAQQASRNTLIGQTIIQVFLSCCICLFLGVLYILIGPIRVPNSSLVFIITITVAATILLMLAITQSLKLFKIIRLLGFKLKSVDNQLDDKKVEEVEESK